MSNVILKPSSPENPIKEKITLNKDSMKMALQSFTGIQGEFWVSIIPAVNVSAYGKTEFESIENLKENLDLFCDDLFSLKPDRRLLELQKLGWEADKLFKKRLSKTFVDENGILQGFDHPEQVKKNFLETV